MFKNNMKKKNCSKIIDLKLAHHFLAAYRELHFCRFPVVFPQVPIVVFALKQYLINFVNVNRLMINLLKSYVSIMSFATLIVKGFHFFYQNVLFHGPIHHPIAIL